MMKCLCTYQRKLLEAFLAPETTHPAAAEAAHALWHLAAARDLLDHALHHLKLLEQAVDVHNLESAAGGDALFPAGVQDLGILPLQRGHGEDDGLRVGDGLLVDLRSLEFIAEIAGHHTCQLAEVAHIPDLLEPFIQAAKELEADGVQAITGSCGFMARFQSQIAAELHVPVFLSSLLQLPLVRLMHGEKAEIGVLTASSQALTPAHFANCATPMESVHIRGMEGNPEFWETIIEGKRHDFDMERLEAEIVGSAAAFAREKALDALVLECTDLSAFSAPIQRAINLPVYDINSLVEYAYYAVCRKDY